MIIIRKEFDSYLIFSTKKKKYYFASNEILQEEMRQIVKNIIRKEKWTKNVVSEKLINQLMELGLNDEEIKYIDKSINREVLSAPLEYYFDFTSSCNLKCNHCYNKAHLNNRTMEIQDIRGIINEMYEYGVMRLHLAGGEPTLYKEKLAAYLSCAN